MSIEQRWARAVLIEDDTASAKRPFIGLRPFDYRDRAFFFGRTESVDAVESLVVQSGFVAVVGSSGTGKSSLVRAGLLPRLEARANERWRPATMAPGDAPIRRLARALSSLRGEDELSEAWNERIEVCLRSSKFGVPEAISLFPEAKRTGHTVIIVDQFEELFRFASLRTDPNNMSAAASLNRDEATAFVRLLLTANSIESIRVHVVITMRSDFIGECAHFHQLPEEVTRHQFLAPGLTRDQRAMAIRNPVDAAGAEIDPELVQRVLNDTNEDPDQLPIIQHAMMRCWQSALDRGRNGARIRLEVDDYFVIGRVANALSMHADQIFEEFKREDANLNPIVSRELVAKRVFQALTEVDQDGRVVRRPMKFGALAAYISSSDWADDETRKAVLSVVTRLAAPDCSFLRITKTDSLDDNSIVDIGHEALIRRWSKLKGGGETDWIREEQDDGEKYRDLVRICRARSTIPDAELPAYERWWAQRKPSAAWAKRYTKAGTCCFADVGETLARSRKEYEEGERERAAAARAERDAQEAQLKLAAAQAKAEAQNARAYAAEERAKAAAAQVAVHAQKARMMLIAASAALAFIALAAPFGFEFYQNQEALRVRREQQEQLIATAAEGIRTAPLLVGAADSLNLLTALPSNDWNKRFFDEVYDSLSSLREVRRIDVIDPSTTGGQRPTVNSVSANPNPKKPLLVAMTMGSPAVMHFLEMRDGGKLVSRLDGMDVPIQSIGWVLARWSPDGERIYVGGGGPNGAIIRPCGVAKLRPYLDGCSGKNENETVPVGDNAHQAGIGVWSGDGNHIVTNNFQGQPNVWDASTGKLDTALTEIVASVQKPERSLTSLAISSSGKFVAEGDAKGAITVVQVDPREIEPALEQKQSGVSAMQIFFNPVNDDQLFAVYQNRALLWNVKEVESKFLDHQQARVMQAAFDPKGRFVVTAAIDGTVRLFALNEGKETMGVELRGHHGPVFSVDVAPDGTIVSGSADGSIRFWRADAVRAAGEPRSYEPGDVEKLKRFVADHLPYVDYGAKRIQLPEAISCPLAGQCSKSADEGGIR